MARRLPATALLLVLVAAWLVLVAPAAHAACHVAGFVETEVETGEAAGVVSLVVELQGRAGSCAGTVDVATIDGTATAGDDYEALTQTLTFEADDDRVETIEIMLVADDEAEGSETFTVELSDPTGDISSTAGPATVTLTEGGAGAEGADDEPTEPATVTDDTADDAQDDVVAEDADEAEDEGGNLGIIIAVVGAIAIGVGAFALLRGRG